MEGMEAFEGFWWGAFGGIAAEGFALYNLAQKKPSNAPDLLKSFWYWVFITFRILASGVMVVAYIKSNMSLTPILAIHVGISTPFIIGSFMSQTPPIHPGESD